MRRIFFYSILIFVFSIGIGYYYSSLWKKDNISYLEEHNLIKKQNTTETAFIEDKVGIKTIFGIKKEYNECGHSELHYVELPKELINLTKEEIRKLYSDWNLESFSKDEIVLAKAIDGICGNHYILKLDDNTVNVYHIKENEEISFVRTTDINKEYLTNDDIKKLEEGIYVYGINNLNAVLEDYE